MNYLTLRNDSVVENGVSVTSFKASGYKMVSMPDFISVYEENIKPTHLHVDLEEWIKEEISKIDLSVCDNEDEASGYVFGEADFLELALDKLGIDVADHPDLRDLQHELLRDYIEELEEAEKK